MGIVGVGKKSLMRRFGGAEFSSSEISKMTSHFVSSDIDRFIIKTWDDSVSEHIVICTCNLIQCMIII